MFHSLSFFLLAALLAVVFVIMSFIVFDRLLRIQFSDARSEWESDDCPSGYFWAPPGSKRLSPRARGNLLSHWFYHRPAWVSSSAQAARLYGLLRLATYLAAIALAPVLLGSVAWIARSVLFVVTALVGR